MHSSRRLRVLQPIPLPALAAALQVHRGELEERAELRAAWTSTIEWFALVVVLLLGLLVVRRRRKPIPLLDRLFRVRRLPDLQVWRRDRDVTTDATAGAAEPPPVPRGPPTIGPVRRFGICLLVGTIASVVYSLHVAAEAREWALLGVVFFGGAAFLASLLASFLCAVIISVLPRQHVLIAAACGALSAAVSLIFVPLLAEISVATVVITGAFAGLVVGLADESSRVAIDATSGAAGPSRAPAVPAAPPPEPR